MAQEKDNQVEHIAQLEYLIRKYYQEHFRPVVDREYHELEAKQDKEMGAAFDKVAARHTVGAGAETALGDWLVARNSVNTEGQWNTKTTDDLLKSVRQELDGRDGVKNDITTLVAAWKAVIKEHIGEERYDRLSAQCPSNDLATQYVNDRLDGFFVEQVAGYKKASGTVDYLLKKGFGDSLMGMLYGISDRHQTDLDKKVEVLSDELYGASFWERAGAVGISVAVDAPLLSGIGSGAKGAWQGGKFLVKEGTAVLSRQAAKTAATEISLATGKEVVKNEAKTVALEGVKKGGSTVLRDKAVTAMQYVGSEMVITKAISLLCSSGDQRKAVSAFIFDDDSILAAADQVSLQYDLLSHDKEKLYIIPELQKAGFSFTPPSLPKDTSVIDFVNAHLSLQVHDAPHIDKVVNKEEVVALQHELAEKAADSGEHIRSSLEKFYEAEGVSYVRDEATDRYASLSDNELYVRSTESAALAMLMSRYHQRETDYFGDRQTLEQVATRAYTLSRVLEDRQHRAQEASVQTVPSHQRQDGDVVERQEDAPTRQPISSHQSGWNGLLSMLGFDGIGRCGENLGSVIAMLPEMIVGMFTGRTKNLRIEDNLMPIAAICLGMYTRNPMLKMLLIGLAGANLLNKGAKELLGEDVRREFPVRQYCAYADEPLNARLRNVKIKDNAVYCDIDGKPLQVVVSDDAVLAYQRGQLPLNTLANAVLGQYDRQREQAGSVYERQMSDNEGQERSVVLR